MASSSQNTTIEGFIADPAFVDQRKSINGILFDSGAKVAALTAPALAYFTDPAVFADTRNPNTRTVNWATVTNPRVIVDQTVFAGFCSTINGLSGPVTAGFFKLIDKLIFDYTPANTTSSLEAFLLADSDIAAIYIPGSFSVSSTILNDVVYPGGNTTTNVAVPASIGFSITLPVGQTTQNYDLILYASVDAFLLGYNSSTIVKVIPPLPYAQLYTASLISNTTNVFTAAATTATLSYNYTKPVIQDGTLSGITEYNAVITDGSASIQAPFNILYKGRTPTLFEIRNAIQTALLSSGIGDADGWKSRIPGVFVAGRFYIIPFWDQTYIKPDQVVFPSIQDYGKIAQITNKILRTLGNGDISEYIDVLSIYFDRMTATAVPDLSGNVDVNSLLSVIPDYQNYAPTDENFSYMLAQTQQFSNILNLVLALNSGNLPSDIYTPVTENLLTFYSFTVGAYEICVITKDCYSVQMGSSL